MAKKPPHEIKCTWLQQLVFRAGLYEHASLTPIEQQALSLFLVKCQSLQEVANQLSLTEDRAGYLLENAMSKLLQAVKNMITRENLLDSVISETKKLKQELSALKALQQTQAIVQPAQKKVNPILIDNCRLTSRAKKILASQQIVYVAELSNLSKEKLLALPRVGIKTLDEITTFAEDCGIRIR